MARPKKPQEELRVDLRMRVCPKLKEDARKAANDAGQSVTAWVEDAIREQIKRELASDA